MSILKNAPQPELIPTYDGSNQSTHPSEKVKTKLQKFIKKFK